MALKHVKILIDYYNRSISLVNNFLEPCPIHCSHESYLITNYHGVVWIAYKWNNMNTPSITVNQVKVVVKGTWREIQPLVRNGYKFIKYVLEPYEKYERKEPMKGFIWAYEGYEEPTSSFSFKPK